MTKKREKVYFCEGSYKHQEETSVVQREMQNSME